MKRAMWMYYGCALAAACMTFAAGFAFGDGKPLLTAGDYDGDGWSDYLLVTSDGAALLQQNTGAGDFTARAEWRYGGAEVDEVQFIDVNRDGALDAAARHAALGGVSFNPGPDFKANAAQWLTGLGAELTGAAGLGDSSETLMLGFSGQPGLARLTVGEKGLTRDGYEAMKSEASITALQSGAMRGGAAGDLVLLTRGAIQIGPFPTSGSWSPAYSLDLDGNAYNTLLIGRFNKDANDDAIALNNAGNAILVYGDASGAYTKQSVTLAPAAHWMTDDLNGDGLSDLIAIGVERNELAVWINQSGSFSTTNIKTSGETIDAAAAGYFSQKSDKEILMLLRGDDGTSRMAAFGGFGSGTPVERLSLSEPIALTSNGPANVLVFKQDELDRGDPFAYGSYHVDDWTTQAKIIAGSIVVSREILADGAFTPAADVTIGGLDVFGDASALSIGVNQVSGDRSQVSLSAAAPPTAVRLEASPASGAYSRTLRPSASVEDGAEAFYRIDGGAWTPYESGVTEIAVIDDSDVSFYAVQDGQYSAVITRTYTMSVPASYDSDGDGIPDRYEDTLGLPMFSSDFDFDGDGWLDLDELIRGSDPASSASVPADSDTPDHIDASMPTAGDGWSDFDESARGTDAYDPGSKPSASGLYEGEIVLTVHNPFGDDARLSAYAVNGEKISAGAVDDESWPMRLGGGEPSILRAQSENGSTLTLLAYSWTFQPAWDPASLATDGMSASAWLNSVKTYAQSAFVEPRSLELSAHSTAAAVLWQYWLAKATGLPGPIVSSDASSYPSETRVQELSQRYDLDGAFDALDAGLVSDHAWSQLVTTLIAAAEMEAPARPVDALLAEWLWGEIDESSKPATLSDAQIMAAADAAHTLVESIASREIALSGEISHTDGELTLRTSDQSYRLDAGSAVLADGDILSATVRLSATADETAAKLVKVISLTSNVSLNETDSDGDGLPDQWEAYYFASQDAKPGEDPDADGFTNLSELNGYSNPIDGSSRPSATTPTPFPTPPPEVTPTPTPPHTAVIDWLAY
ncbi:MAG: hypothetical protein GC154_15075 [bacterium]|nr:hypothetical protein [bacterium]